MLWTINPDVAGFLFDGFPRTAIQAQELDDLLAKKNTCIDVMLALEVSEEELIKRLVKRGETSGRSDDSNEMVIRARILEYHKKTASVADHYRRENKVVMVKGEGTIEEIFKRLTDEIDRLMKMIIAFDYSLSNLLPPIFIPLAIVKQLFSPIFIFSFFPFFTFHFASLFISIWEMISFAAILQL